MHHRVLLLTTLLATLPLPSSIAQAIDDALSLAPIESSPPPPEILGPEQSPSDHSPPEPEDAVLALGELRGAVRVAPGNAGDRLKLAYALYRIGDLDAAIEECRIAIKLEPNDARSEEHTSELQS